MLIDRLGLWDINIWALWPLILVFVGGRIFLRAFNPDEAHAATFGDTVAFVPDLSSGETTAPVSGPVETGATISATALMGGFNRKVVSPAFHRAELTAFMGGGKLDLRDAKLVDGRGVIDVFAMMGGFEILVPDTWNIEVEVVPFMGNCEDKTVRHPEGAAPRLVVRGFVMMGGVDIKNNR
jgi:hypothetical protein